MGALLKESRHIRVRRLTRVDFPEQDAPVMAIVSEKHFPSFIEIRMTLMASWPGM